MHPQFSLLSIKWWCVECHRKNDICISAWNCCRPENPGAQVSFAVVENATQTLLILRIEWMSFGIECDCTCDLIRSGAYVSSTCSQLHCGGQTHYRYAIETRTVTSYLIAVELIYDGILLTRTNLTRCTWAPASFPPEVWFARNGNLDAVMCRAASGDLVLLHLNLLELDDSHSKISVGEFPHLLNMTRSREHIEFTSVLRFEFIDWFHLSFQLITSSDLCRFRLRSLAYPVYL